MVHLAEARMLREVEDNQQEQEQELEDSTEYTARKGRGGVSATIRSIHRNRAYDKASTVPDDELPNHSTFVHYDQQTHHSS